MTGFLFSLSLFLSCTPWFDQIDYPSFNRNFYEEHPEITALSKQEVIELKKKLGIKVRAYISKITMIYAEYVLEHHGSFTPIHIHVSVLITISLKF